MPGHVTVPLLAINKLIEKLPLSFLLAVGAVQRWQEADGSGLQEGEVLRSPRRKGGCGVWWSPRGWAEQGSELARPPAGPGPQLSQEPITTHGDLPY